MKKQTGNEDGSVLVIALLLIVLLLMIGTALLSTSEVEGTIAANDQWSEGAFFAAEAAVQVGIDQIGDSVATSTAPIPLTDLGGTFSFRSGSIEDAAPQPLRLVGSLAREGYAAGEGTGYHSEGFLFDVYQITATGIGPRNAQREVEVQVEYGPVAR